MLERCRRTVLPKKKDTRNENRHINFWIDEIGSYRLAAATRSQDVLGAQSERPLPTRSIPLEIPNVQ